MIKINISVLMKLVIYIIKDRLFVVFFMIASIDAHISGCRLMVTKIIIHAKSRSHVHYTIHHGYSFVN